MKLRTVTIGLASVLSLPVIVGVLCLVWELLFSPSDNLEDTKRLLWILLSCGYVPLITLFLALYLRSPAAHKFLVVTSLLYVFSFIVLLPIPGASPSVGNLFFTGWLVLWFAAFVAEWQYLQNPTEP